VLDTLRRLRNVAEYTGDDVDETTAQHCIAEAERLIDDVAAWRKTNWPDLISQKNESCALARRRPTPSTGATLPVAHCTELH